MWGQHSHQHPAKLLVILPAEEMIRLRGTLGLCSFGRPWKYAKLQFSERKRLNKSGSEQLAGKSFILFLSSLLVFSLGHLRSLSYLAVLDRTSLAFRLYESASNITIRHLLSAGRSFHIVPLRNRLECSFLMSLGKEWSLFPY